jgi:hypothetical protein
MATIKYKGMELEEVTTPQIFDPPQEMLVIDELDDKPIKKKVAAILATGYCHNVVATDETFWQSCFRIPDPPKPRRATNRELARWLAQGNGEVLCSDHRMIHSFWEYDVVTSGLSVCDDARVRKWDDTEWHEPTVEYLFGVEG